MSDLNRIGQHEHKSLPYEIKAAAMDDSGQYAGEFTGYAAGILNVDKSGDMILPGAFTEDLPRFLSDGVVCWQHDWMTPIGVPLEAKEDGYGLMTRSRISRTPKGLEAMTLIRDGVVKRLSIGYQVQEYEVTDKTGMVAAMGAYGVPLERQMAAMAAFDEMGNDKIYLLKKLKLYEYSPVTVPANDNATILDAKSLTGLAFTDHSRAVLTAVEGLEKRIREISELRKSQGRKASPSHGEMCASMADDLEKACGRLRKMAEEMVDSTAPADETAKRLHAEFLKLQAAALGAA
jgi:HK97 family phage prohead protease